MTAPARITQADIDRATKAVKDAGYTKARIVMRLEQREIEIILDESAPDPATGNPCDVLLNL